MISELYPELNISRPGLILERSDCSPELNKKLMTICREWTKIIHEVEKRCSHFP